MIPLPVLNESLVGASETCALLSPAVLPAQGSNSDDDSMQHRANHQASATWLKISAIGIT